jgi:YL1 nuclear protein/YL1 nuclear protein C-terminal domain
MDRSRRATAGKRMTQLVGKAQEEDSAFWAHDTWESDEESFHASDEGSVKDEFDSDFDESESDHEDEEVAASEAQEKELLVAERQSSKRHVDISKAGRDLWRRGKTKGVSQKRALGQGLNAGLVLNVPPPTAALSAQSPSATIAASEATTANATANASTTSQSAASTAITAVVSMSVPKHSRISYNDMIAPLAATRPRRAAGMSIYSSRYRAARSDASTASGAGAAATNRKSTSSSSAAASQKKKKRQRYSQEELLLEAIHETEPENERWRLARKRMQEENDARRENNNASSSGTGTLIERYASRRGYLTTVHFPEMDHLPAYLIPKPSPVEPDATICAITGQNARYKDPLTGYGYHDMEAFRELRKRHAEGTLKTAKAKVSKSSGRVSQATEIADSTLSAVDYSINEKNGEQTGDLDAEVVDVADSKPPATNGGTKRRASSTKSTPRKAKQPRTSRKDSAKRPRVSKKAQLAAAKEAAAADTAASQSTSDQMNDAQPSSTTPVKANGEIATTATATNTTENASSVHASSSTLAAESTTTTSTQEHISLATNASSTTQQNSSDTNRPGGDFASPLQNVQSPEVQENTETAAATTTATVQEDKVQKPSRSSSKRVSTPKSSEPKAPRKPRAPAKPRAPRKPTRATKTPATPTPSQAGTSATSTARAPASSTTTSTSTFNPPHNSTGVDSVQVEPQNSLGTSPVGSRQSPRKHRPTSKLIENMALPLPIVSLPSLVPASLPSTEPGSMVEEVSVTVPSDEK